MDATYLIIVSAISCVLSVVILFIFFYHRVRWWGWKAGRKEGGNERPGLVASVRNMFLILLWITVSFMILFLGFFIRSYHTFTFEEPVAEIYVRPASGQREIKVELIQYAVDSPDTSREYIIRGDQWMLEGDILKWDNWLNFVGFQTLYRFTRIRGRYLSTEDELRQPGTIYSLVPDETHPLWRYLYNYGAGLPFVSTVYGNAVFQNNTVNKHFLISVSTSGFIAREKKDNN